jgi:hypothetical protein
MKAARRLVELGLKAIEMTMPTDPTKFEGLPPFEARALAEIIDNVDEAADPAALMWNCDFEIELANAIALQIDATSHRRNQASSGTHPNL